MEKESKNYLERMGQSIKSSVTLKLLSIFILMMLLLIPINIIQGVISEREMLKEQTVKEVSSKWANEQYVYGPILTIPIQKQVIVDSKLVTVKEEAHILPSKLKIGGEVVPQVLNRGIYEVVVYNSDLEISGYFEGLQGYLDDLSDYDLFLEDAFLTFHVSDLRGIKEKVIIKWSGLDKSVVPGSNIPHLINSGFTVKDVLSASIDDLYEFDFQMKLQGSQYLGFMPLGKESQVKLHSEWRDPSFIGSFLPDTRNVSDQGFTAEWNVLELNRNYPQFWIGQKNVQEISNSSFGVSLLLPINDYQKATRSAKYALLAISLTFLNFFLVEIFNKKKLHPFQYILIGLALCLFYTLLVSISEHSNFNFAYLISSTVIIAIIGLYAKAILPSVLQVFALVVILCFTYAFVFVTLQVQDYALLIGSIGLTLILAFTMYITRKINWYEMSSVKGGE